MLNGSMKRVAVGDLATEAAEQTENGSVRIRIQPQIFLPEYGREKGKSGGYLAWRGVYWTLIAENATEANTVREALGRFCALVAEYGPAPVRKWLDTGELADVESAKAEFLRKPDPETPRSEDPS